MGVRVHYVQARCSQLTFLQIDSVGILSYYYRTAQGSIADFSLSNRDPSEA